MRFSYHLLPTSYSGKLLLWSILWFGGFSFSMLFSIFDVNVYSSNAFYVLIIRDIVIGSFGHFLWRNLNQVNSSIRGKFNPLEMALATLCLIMTSYYLFLAFKHEGLSPPGPLIFTQLSPLAPLKAFSLVFFQQTLIVLYLLGINQDKFGKHRGILITALFFCLSHLAGPLIGIPWSYSIALTILSGVAMLIWGHLFTYKRLRFFPIFSHYLFYIAVMTVLSDR